MKEVTMEVIDTVFAPKTIAKQLVLSMALQTGAVTVHELWKVLRMLFSNFSSRSRLTRQLHRQQHQAATQDEWMDLAERIDNIQGNDVWRSDPSCALYERDRITARIDEFIHLMRRRDIFELMFTLRGGINRNKFGLLHEGLFSKALAGSKILVETYHNVVCAALDFVCDGKVPPDEEPIPTEARLAFFNETRHSYGRTALLLSGGAALGFYHTGVVKTLMENGLMPRVIGGSSAGSIVCAMIGTRTDDECLDQLFHAEGTNAPGHYGRLQLNFFRPIGKQAGDASNGALADGSGGVGDGRRFQTDIGKVYNNTAGFLHDAKRTWQIFVPIGLRHFTSTVYDLLTGNRRPQDLLMQDTEYFRECVRINVGDFTFQEAFDRTGRILNITVTPKNSSDPPRLLNYLTAPHVLVWSAAVASSSLPGVFEANKLMVRDADGTERFESAEPTRFSDGSMEQDLPMQQLSEMFNVNHFIISQANPHAVWFASFGMTISVWNNPLFGLVTGTLTFLKNQVRSWLRDLVELVGGRRIAPLFDTRRGMFSQFFVQEYQGRECDISLIPWWSHRGVWSALLHCIYNPTHEDFVEWGQAAERETWKYIPAIKSHIAEEVTLDRCVQRLRKRLLMESWEKKQHKSSTGEKMGSRVPSFFTSPSLVNMGGLGIADRTKLSYGDSAQEEYDSWVRQDKAKIQDTLAPDFEVRQGWGGQGLSGNTSSASLTKSGSGLFIDGEDTPEQQHAGEHTYTVPAMGMSSNKTKAIDDDTPDGYIKTTNMALFYYRKTKSMGSLRQIKSHQEITQASVHSSDNESIDDSVNEMTRRRKSKSIADLSTIVDVPAY